MKCKWLITFLSIMALSFLFGCETEGIDVSDSKYEEYTGTLKEVSCESKDNKVVFEDATSFYVDRQICDTFKNSGATGSLMRILYDNENLYAVLFEFLDQDSITKDKQNKSKDNKESFGEVKGKVTGTYCEANVSRQPTVYSTVTLNNKIALNLSYKQCIVLKENSHLHMHYDKQLLEVKSFKYYSTNIDARSIRKD